MKKGLFILIAVILISGCYSQQTKTSNTERGANEVIIDNFAFTPQELTINSGTTITWKNNHNVVHTIVSQNLFESKTLNKGDEFAFTFNTPGEYNYYCSIHPSMRGRIIIVK